MSLEIKVNDSFVPFEFVDNSTKLDLEIALVTGAEMKVNCYTCHKSIPNGIGAYCNSCRQVNLKTCKVCEYAHEGLYCSNCFTGKRVNVSKKPNGFRFARVIKLTPITCKK